MATPLPTRRRQPPRRLYADLDPETKKKVNDAAKEIYGDGGHMSVDAWWETLDCRKMRVAAGDGNTADPTGHYCTHYPGSDFLPEKILSTEALAHVNKIGHDAPDLVVVGCQLDRGPDDEATVAHRPREHAPERRRGRG